MLAHLIITSGTWRLGCNGLTLTCPPLRTLSHLDISFNLWTFRNQIQSFAFRNLERNIYEAHL